MNSSASREAWITYPLINFNPLTVFVRATESSQTKLAVSACRQAFTAQEWSTQGVIPG